MTKRGIVALLVAASLGAAVGFGLGSATNPAPAGAAGGSADLVVLKKIDADLRRQLGTTNSQLAALNTKLGSQGAKGTGLWLLTTICNYTASIDCGP